MISARRCLFGAVREFIDREIPGIITWDKLTIHDAEPMPPLENGRKNPLGKFREKVAVSFNGFTIEACSPEEKPALGSVNLYVDGNFFAGGPLDTKTWAWIGSIIKERSHGG